MSYSAQLFIGTLTDSGITVEDRRHTLLNTIAFIESGSLGENVRATKDDPFVAVYRNDDERCRDPFGTVLQAVPMERAMEQLAQTIEKSDPQDVGRIQVALATMKELKKAFPRVRQFYVVAYGH